MKKVVIVLKDTVDLKNMILLDELKSVLAGSHCIIYAPFPQLINKLKPFCLPTVKKLQIKELPETNGFEKIMKGVARYAYFTKTALTSTSSLQKILELLKVSNRIAFNASAPFQKIDVLSENSPSKWPESDKIILFMRSDSIQNYKLSRRYKDYLPINMIRNLDAPFLKGPPIAHSQFVINQFYPFVTDADLHPALGREIRMRPPIHKRTEKKPADSSIMYAMTHPNFFPRQVEFICHLNKRLGGRCKLFVKPHGAVRSEDLDLLADREIKIDLSNSILESNFNVADRKGYVENRIATISFASTIIYDYYIAGSQNLFYLKDDSWCDLNGLYNREHLRRLSKLPNLKFISDIDHFIEGQVFL